MKKQLLILTAILFLGGFFRFYQLNQVPPGPSMDEVSIGWNAYSVLKTGEDEYGTRWPILLRAYDDWRPALYVYFVIPFLKIFALSASTVRLPSALLSLLAILTTYFLVKELFFRKPTLKFLPLISCFLLAISPWHLYLSRLGHEVNAGLTLSLVAILFFLKWMRAVEATASRRIKWLLLSAFFFGLSFYTYQSFKVFGPLLLASLGLIYRKQGMKAKKELIMAILLGLLIILPLLRVSFSSGGLIRFQGTSVFNNSPEVIQRASLRMVNSQRGYHFLGYFFDNRRVGLGLKVINNYLVHFNPSWLFLNTGQEDHKVPGLGLFYLWELPFLLIGLYSLARLKGFRKERRLLLIWILISPLAGAITTGAPHAMRSFNALPVPQILIGLGLVSTWSQLSKRPKFSPTKWLMIGSLLLISSLAYLFHQYFVNFPFEQSASFQAELPKAIHYAQEKESEYRKIVFTNYQHSAQAYMFYLFFTQFNPRKYQAFGGTASAGFEQPHQIGQYEFRSLDWPREEAETTLFIGNPSDFGGDFYKLEEFISSSGKVSLVAGEKPVSDFN